MKPLRRVQVSNIRITLSAQSFPVLRYIEGPLELQVCMVVIIHELRDCIVVAPCQHSRRSFILRNYNIRKYRCQNRSGASAHISSHISASLRYLVDTIPIIAGLAPSLFPKTVYIHPTYNHLLFFPNSHTLPFYYLQIFQPAQHIMLYLKGGLHAKL